MLLFWCLYFPSSFGFHSSTFVPNNLLWWMILLNLALRCLWRFLNMFLVTCPSSLILFLKTHFVPITFLSFGLGTSSHVSFFSIWLSSSSIALIQCSSFFASLKLLGSTMDSKDKCTCSGVFSSLLHLVSIPTLLSPIICSGGWFFWPWFLGVLEGV